MLHYAGVPFEEKTYILGESEWANDKQNMFAFVNLPYLIVGDFKISESFAVHQYIAQKFKPELLGETPQERARNYQLQSIANDNFITFMKLGFMKEEKSYTANYCFRYM